MAGWVELPDLPDLPDQPERPEQLARRPGLARPPGSFVGGALCRRVTTQQKARTIVLFVER